MLRSLPQCWCRGRCPHAAGLKALENRPKLAEARAKSVLLDAPRCAEAHKIVALHLSASNRASAAQDHLEIARDVVGLTPELALQTAYNLRSGARIPEAISAAEQSRILSPDNVHAWVALGAALQADGRVDEAAATIAEAEKKFGRVVPLRRLAAVVKADAGDYEGAITRLTGGDDLLPMELLDRGRFYEKLGHYERAWSDWMLAKQMQRDKGCIYPVAQVAKTIADLTEMSRFPRIEYLRQVSEPGPRPWPIFVTGFPRSGTTMVEAALSAHPEIAPGDELMFISELIEHSPSFLSVRDPYPRCLMATSFPENAVVPALMRDYYKGKALQKITETLGWGREAQYFTDKMPSNEMHWLLIWLLFPTSPVVHVRRHPLDILVSNMSHHLVHGSFNACSLEWCATHYALTDGLVDHYRTRLRGMLDLTEVRYEKFVADHRTVIDGILPKDLKPDERCYDFHLSDWHSRTISYRQIKAPVNDKSVGRYKPFLDFLRPIVPIVQATLDREGYSL